MLITGSGINENKFEMSGSWLWLWHFLGTLGNISYLATVFVPYGGRLNLILCQPSESEQSLLIRVTGKGTLVLCGWWYFKRTCATTKRGQCQKLLLVPYIVLANSEAKAPDSDYAHPHGSPEPSLFGFVIRTLFTWAGSVVEFLLVLFINMTYMYFWWQ